MAAKTKNFQKKQLPSSFDELVRIMPPMAIHDDIHHQNTVELIDRLMQIENLSPGQSDYLETLVELVEVYETKQHAINLTKISGIRMLKHVVEQANLSASDLARLLKVHPTMGSKILKGERQLTWDHAKVLATHFKVTPVLFMNS